MNNPSHLLKHQDFSQHYYILDTSCRVHHKFWNNMVVVVKPYLINFFCICSYTSFTAKSDAFFKPCTLHLYQKIQKRKLNKELVFQCKQADWSLLIINEGDEQFSRHVNEQATLLKGQNLSTVSGLCSFQSISLSLGSESITNATTKSEGFFTTFQFCSVPLVEHLWVQKHK